MLAGNSNEIEFCIICLAKSVKHFRVGKRTKQVLTIAVGIMVLVIMTGLAISLWKVHEVADDAVSTAVAGGHEVKKTMTMALEHTGNRIREILNATDKNYGEIQKAVLHVTETVAHAAAVGIENFTAPIEDAIGSVAAVGLKIENVASYAIRSAMHVLFCIFSTKKECDEAFYEKFHLCDYEPKTVVMSSGETLSVVHPCNHWGKEVKTQKVENWINYGWQERLSAFTKFAYDPNNDINHIRKYIKDHGMYDWNNWHAPKTCNLFENQRDRKRCLQNKCWKEDQTEFGFETCLLVHANIAPPQDGYEKIINLTLEEARQMVKQNKTEELGRKISNEGCLDKNGRCLSKPTPQNPKGCMLFRGRCRRLI